MANWEGKPTLASVLKGYTPPTESALADPIKEHLRTLPAQLATNQAALDNAIASWNKTDFATGKPNPNYRPEAIQELAQLMPGIGGLTAWHGTPHKIVGNFDISKVGTGEGAQAYGHGMYFAENPEVATQYRKMLSTPFKETGSASQLLDMANGNYDEAIKLAQKNKNIAEIHSGKAEHIESANKTLDILNKMKNGEKLEFGNLYKVDIPDEYIPTMMLWDKPLGQQPDVVKKAINSIKSKITPEMRDELGGDLNLLFGKDVTPNQFLNTLEIIHPESPVGIGEKWLNEAGVKGIRYWDFGSRQGEKGTSNFVVFDPSTVKILEENSKPVSRKELIEQQVKKLKD